MKVGTDGVLLGAWTSLATNPDAILDIGAGTGVIALMMAQRSGAPTIDALEIDDEAYVQCVNNFESSPWGDRLFCYHAGLEEFTEDIEDQYNLIISNPPFYSEDVGSGNNARDMARQSRSLPFEELIEGVSSLLSRQGTFSTIIPFKEEQHFIALAEGIGLYPQRITRVKGRPASEIKRSLLEFRYEKKEVMVEELIIETERHHYTANYIALTREFYLKM
jgi:tRNA1Val (adenine37-N6)-methyltransferase